jgi:hypothetical protein
LKRFIPILLGAPLLVGCAVHEKKLLMAADPTVQVAQDPPPPPPPPPPEPPPTPKRWYGWKLLVAYAPIDFALAWGAYFAMQKELNTAIPLLALGYGGHLAAGGFMHKFHDGDEKKGTGSMLMQMGVMAVGFTVGVLATPEEEAKRTKKPSTATMLAGSIGGAIVAGAIDVGIMSWEPIYGSTAKRNVEWMVLPMPVGEKGMGVGIGGTF